MAQPSHQSPADTDATYSPVFGGKAQLIMWERRTEETILLGNTSFFKGFVWLYCDTHQIWAIVFTAYKHTMQAGPIAHSAPGDAKSVHSRAYRINRQSGYPVVFS